MLKFDSTEEDHEKATKALYKAVEVGFPKSLVLECRMDLDAVHSNGCPLDFDKLAGFDEVSLLHDLHGIRANLNRTTGVLENFFCPRCAV